jgi:hypothetical protein
MTQYKVYGDYGYTTQCLLKDSATLGEAIEFARGYTRYGDMGGYSVIEVVWFDEDGQFHAAWTMHSEDYANIDEDELLYEE